MIRWAGLLVLLAGPVSAASLAECEALAARLTVQVAEVEQIAGVCLFTDVRIEQAQQVWRARRISLGGDIDALPDALPRRLSGGVTGLALEPQMPGQPGLAWLVRQQAHPGLTLTFDATAEAGVLRVNSFVLRMDDTNEVALTARIAGVPEVWPVDPIAASAMRVQALDMEIVFDGLFEDLLLLPLGTGLLDLAQPAEPQVAALRTRMATVLSGFDGTPQAGNAAQAQAFLDALPHPRGTLEIGIGGAGLSALQLLPLLSGTVTADFAARVADAAALDIYWELEDP